MLLAGKITGEALKYAETLIKPNISTFELDKLIEMYIIDRGAKPSFLHFEGYPASICASINDTIVHGIPSKNIILQEGDIISIDVGAKFKGYNGDAARTFAVGNVTETAYHMDRVFLLKIELNHHMLIEIKCLHIHSIPLYQKF